MFLEKRELGPLSTHRVLSSTALLLPINETDQVGERNANGVADPYMHKVSSFADSVDDRGAHSQELGDLADGEQCTSRTSCGTML